MSLYFIALIPQYALRKQIKQLKQEMKLQFKAKHALKSPAHITLQRPFIRNEENELLLLNNLKEFSSIQQPFNIDLLGFGCFTPRVIFVKIANHEPIITMYKQLKKVLIKKLGFNKTEIASSIFPHITIATKDLTEDAFKAAWPKFEKRAFKATFLVNSLFLLKHNGKYWDIYKEFGFKKTTN